MHAVECSRIRREHAAAFLVLAMVTLCAFHRLTLHPGEILVGPQKMGHTDLTDFFSPVRGYAATAVLDHGQLPFWNPYICLGHPYIGNAQSAIYYPPNWILLGVDIETGLSWLLVAHHLFAGLGAYSLARKFGLGWFAGVLGGAVYLAAPFLMAQAAEGHYAQICAVAWGPWAMLAYQTLRDGIAKTPSERYRDSRPPAVDPSRGKARGVVPLTFCLAMSFFAGHAQETYYLVLILTAFVLWDACLLARRQRRADAVNLLTRYARAGVITAGLVAVDLLPIFLSSKRTLRPAIGKVQAGFDRSPLTLESLKELLDPFALSRPEMAVSGIAHYWEKVCHFGVLPLLLAAAAMLFVRRSSAARRMGVLWIVTLLFAFGSLTPVYSGLAAFVPGLTWFRLPSRVLFFTSLATAMLAAVTVHELVCRLEKKRTALAMAVAVATLASCTFELSRFAHQVTDTARMFPLELRDPELLALLKSAPADRSGAQRVLTIQDVLSDRDAARHGIHKLRGYEPAGPARYLLLTSMLQQPGARMIEPMGFLPGHVSRLNQQLLDLMSVRYATQLRDPDSPAEEIDGWRRIRSSQVVGSVVGRRAEGRRLFYTYDLLENDSALPRAFVVGNVRELSGFGEFRDAIDEVDFRSEVVLKKDVLPTGPRTAFRPARIFVDGPNHLEIEAELDAPGYLVVSDLWYPGWDARSGEQRLPVHEANGGFRAVPLPAGRHVVEMTFVTPGWIAGATVSLATLITVLLTRAMRRLSTRRNVVPPSSGRSIPHPARASTLSLQNSTVRNENAEC